MNLRSTGNRRLSLFLVIASALALVLAGAASASGGSAARSGNDPLERVNRAIFWFNDKVDIHVLEPAAKGWDWIVPDRVQQSVSNFFANLRFPVVATNDLLQAKPHRVAVDVARFIANSTFGLLGLFDPATQWGLEHNDEDFGQTLGYWGVPPGPYLVLPLVGPSNPRDGAGLFADSFASIYPLFVGYPYTTAAWTVDLVNFRAQVLDQVRDAKDAAVDYYAFTRDAYQQRRERLVSDHQGLSEEEQEELYFEEFDDEE